MKRVAENFNVSLTMLKKNSKKYHLRLKNPSLVDLAYPKGLSISVVDAPIQFPIYGYLPVND